MLIAFALGAASPSTYATEQLSKMAALFDEVCLKTFPDDSAVEALMMKRHARELTPDQVKVTMRDDPARAWYVVPDGSVSVWIEFPPYHACSVRWNAREIGDMSAYRAIADRYEREKGEFHPVDPFDADQGDIHIHAIGEQRIRADGTPESLFFFDQHISNPSRRAAGETGVVLRFVHQFAPARPPEQ